MANNIPLDKAELLSTLLEAILYGFSLLMFGETISQLTFRRCTQKVNIKIVVAASLLLLCSTVHIVIDIVRIMEGLVLYRDTYPGGPIAYFSNASHWTFVSKNYVYVVHTLVGDSIVLYRCYMIWQSKVVMILPVLLWSAIGITGFVAASELLSGSSVFRERLAVWIKAFYACALATSVLTTFLLAYRIWQIDQNAKKLRGHPETQLRYIQRIIVDAGVIYSLTLLTVIICFTLQSNSQYVILDMLVPIISITFYMVIIRVGTFSHRMSLQPRTTSHPYTENSFCAETGNRLEAVIVTTLSEDLTVDNCQRSTEFDDCR